MFKVWSNTQISSFSYRMHNLLAKGARYMPLVSLGFAFAIIATQGMPDFDPIDYYPPWNRG